MKWFPVHECSELRLVVSAVGCLVSLLILRGPLRMAARTALIQTTSAWIQLIQGRLVGADARPKQRRPLTDGEAGAVPLVHKRASRRFSLSMPPESS